MKKTTLNDALEAYFKARPGQWIDGRQLEKVAGAYAWRSRVSDMRKQRGMDIQNRQRHFREHAPSCPGFQAWPWDDVPGACACDMPTRYVVSEYCYVPSASESSGYACVLLEDRNA